MKCTVYFPDFPCGMETAASEWLQKPEVAEALHVKPGRNSFKYKVSTSNFFKIKK